MQTKRAVLACVDELRRVEAAAAIEAADFALYGTARDADGALTLVREGQPALLLADAVLPGADGVALARRVTGMYLHRYPCVLLMRPRGLKLPEADALAGLGGAVIDRPFDGALLSEAFRALTERGPCLPPEKAARLDQLLDALGVPEHPGRGMLACAVALVWRDRDCLCNLRDNVYPHAGKDTAAARAERAIRHVIEVAWRTGAMDAQQRVFGDTIDARRGRPTCGEMIARLADILRWEG